MAYEKKLPVVVLPGLIADSLGNCLVSLGLLRVLSRKWPAVRTAWRDDVLCVVGGPETFDDLVDELIDVADRRAWTPYERGWAAAQKQGTKEKSGTPLALWQSQAPEDQLPLFAAHAVPHERTTFNPLLGSGGNAGRRDFSSGWSEAVKALAAGQTPKKGARKKNIETTDERRQALAAWLRGEPVSWLLPKLAAGSWFSDATKLYNSGQSVAREGQITPWAMVLACEGLVFFAGSASRRLGALSQRGEGAFPFLTGAAAPMTDKEVGRVQGEVWFPLWERPMSRAEVAALFARGRAEVHGRAATTPATFATAICKRGVDAGVTEFRRFTLGRTTSANTFEPRHAGRLRVERRSPDTVVTVTLERVERMISHPKFPRDRQNEKHFIGLRGPIESALIDVAAAPDDPAARVALLDAVVQALDRIDRAKALREREIRWEPLPLAFLASTFAISRPGPEARLALSCVSSFPVSKSFAASMPFATFRFGVEWTSGHDYAYYTHLKNPPYRWVWGPGDLSRVLVRVLLRQLLDSPEARRYAPCPASAADVTLWLTGEVDLALVDAWLSRLALFDWRDDVSLLRPLLAHQEAEPVRGDLALVGLFQPLVDARPLTIGNDDIFARCPGARTAEVARALVSLLQTGNLDAAFAAARNRYAMALLPLVHPRVDMSTQDPARLIAALLFPLPHHTRSALIQRWLRPTRTEKPQDTHV